jgi:hypothetical protein
MWTISSSLYAGLGDIRAKMQSDKKTMFESPAAEKKRLLQMRRGYDNAVHVNMLTKHIPMYPSADVLV